MKDLKPSTAQTPSAVHMSELRQSKRYNVRLKVTNQDNGELLGNVADINLSGINIKSKNPLPDKQDIKIYICIGGDENDPEEEKIALTVFKVWGAFTDTMPRFHSTGLHFVNPSEEVLDEIQELIYELDGVSITRF